MQNAKNAQFGEFLKSRSLQSNSVTRQVNFNKTKIGWKMPKLTDSNETFWVIFKQRDVEDFDDFTYVSDSLAVDKFLFG